MDPTQNPVPIPPPAPNVAPTTNVPVQPGYNAVPGAVAPVPGAAVDEGKTMGIISIVLAVLGFGLPGIVVGILAKKKSKATGQSNVLATIGIVLSAIETAIATVVIALLVFGTTKIVQKCQELGPGTHVENNVTYTCGANGSSSSTTTP